MVCVCVPSMLPPSARTGTSREQAWLLVAASLQAKRGLTSQQDVGGAAGVQVVLHAATQESDSGCDDGSGHANKGSPHLVHPVGPLRTHSSVSTPTPARPSTCSWCQRTSYACVCPV